MDTMLYGLAGVILSALIHWFKFKFPKVNPIVIGFILAVVGGIGYAMLTGFGYWDTFKHQALIVLAASSLIYQTFLQIMKAAQVDTTMLSQPTTPTPVVPPFNATP